VTPVSADDSEVSTEQEDEPKEESPNNEETSRKVLDSPSSPVTPLTANTQPEPLDPSTDPLSALASGGPLLDHNTGKADDKDDLTLQDLEASVDSPHLDNARDAVEQSAKETLKPLESLNALPVDLDETSQDMQSSAPPLPMGSAPSMDMPLPSLDMQPVQPASGDDSQPSHSHAYLSPAPMSPPPIIPTLSSTDDRNDPNSPNNVAL
jgi:hypothetical protein